MKPKASGGLFCPSIFSFIPGETYPLRTSLSHACYTIFHYTNEKENFSDGSWRIWANKEWGGGGSAAKEKGKERELSRTWQIKKEVNEGREEEQEKRKSKKWSEMRIRKVKRKWRRGEKEKKGGRETEAVFILVSF